MAKTFDDLENAAGKVTTEAEKKLAQVLGPYATAATMAGWAFAAILIAYALLLFSGGALVGACLMLVTAVVLVWLVALLRIARAELVRSPVPPGGAPTDFVVARD
jgi:hypothetical protein